MGLRIKRNVLLANYSTFKIGGRADYFIEVKNRREISFAFSFAQKNRMPIFILGGGSNVLFSDNGFRGVVIKISMNNFRFKNESLFAESGCILGRLVLESINRGLGGIEWAGGIPGTLGGAIRGNAGAFGREIKDVVEEVETFSLNDGSIKRYKNSECQFGYRDSIFKKNKEVILSALLKLKRANKEDLKDLLKQILIYRRTHHPLEYPNAGSIFKNVPLKEVPKRVQEIFKDNIKNDPFPVLPTGLLISHLRLGGMECGGAKISEKHQNFIVNFNQARAVDVLSLIAKIKEKIKENFKIDLKEEIEIVPER